MHSTVYVRDASHASISLYLVRPTTCLSTTSICLYNPRFQLPNNLGTHHIVPIKQVPAVPPVMYSPDESVCLGGGGEGDDVCRRGIFCDSAGAT
jgi:hypothetical protein